MSVQNTQSSKTNLNAQEIKEVKPELPVSLGDKIKAFFSGWFTATPNTEATNTFEAVKLPPVTKASPFTEVSLTMTTIRQVMDSMTPKKPVATQQPSKPVYVAPMKPPASYKDVNPIVLKDFPDFKINIVHKDLFESNAQVIVNAANVGLGGGGGIDGAIHKAGGSDYATRHKALKTQKPDFKEGDALIIEGVSLNSNKRDLTTRESTNQSFTTIKDVIVVAGPNRQGYTDKKGILAHNKELYNCYYNAMQLAHDKKKESIAFPAISVGIFAYPKDEAAKMSLMAINDFAKNHPKTTLKSIDIHCFNPFDLDYNKELADWKFYQTEISKNENFDPIASGTTRPVVVKPLTSAQINKIRADEKKSVKLEMEKLSVDLSQKLSGKANSKPIGHKNFTNTCYMNASLQSLNSAYRVKLPVKNLIGKPLTWDAKDSFDSMEDRLSGWSPILKEKNTLENLQNGKKIFEEKIKSETNLDSRLILLNQLGRINESIKNQTENLTCTVVKAKLLEELKSANDERKALINDELINLEQELSLREDRILFKWSFLLYMQACRYGTEADVEKALLAHHRVCFAIARHDDFTTVPGNQTVREMHDTSSHQKLFNEMLGLGVNASNYKQYIQDGKVVIASHKTCVDGVIDVCLQPGGTFKEGLAKTFEYTGNSEDQTFEDDITSKKFIIPGNQVKDYKKFYGSPSPVITLNVNTNMGQNSLVYDKDKTDKNCYQEVLELGAYFDNNIKANYKLMALSVWNSGHYYSYVKYIKEGTTDVAEWYECNDSKVREINEKDVPFDRASTLTYTKLK